MTRPFQKLKSLKIRTQFALLILAAVVLSYLLFSFLWYNKWTFIGWAEKQFELNSQLSDDTFWNKLYAEALNCDIPKDEHDKDAIQKLQPFFDLTDQYTSIYIYGLEDGLYRAGKTAEIMDNTSFRSFFDFGYRVTGGEGEEFQDFPMQFKNGYATVTVIFYHRSCLIYPYAIFAFCLTILFFLSIMLSFMSRKLKKIAVLKTEILRMASGDLTHPLPNYGGDEIGILSRELNHLRTALDETIQNEQESRKANQDLITAMSHDLRTPLTILNGYLEILKRKGNPTMEAEYLERCLQKSKDIKEMTDRMFEYALVFEHTETPTLVDVPVSTLLKLLCDNCDFAKLAGFQVKTVLTDTDSTFLCDESMLKRILSNLFSNIIKYADKQTPVQVVVSLQTGHVIVQLSNAIKQEHSETESNHIGLKSVEKMMELVGGQILILENETQFSVQLSFCQSEIFHSD